MLQRRWIMLAAVMFLVLAFSAVRVEAAGGSSDGGTVADLFQNQQSPKGQKQQQQNTQKDEKQQEPLTTTSGTAWMFVKVILVLAIVVALIYFLLRFVNARTRSFSEGRTIQNVGGVSVGSNRSVQLVKVGERIFVVGVGEDVSLLKEITDADEISEMIDDHHREDVLDHSFWKLKDWLKKTKVSGNRQGHFKTMLEDRLKQMGQQRKKTMEDLKKKGFKK